MPAGFAFTQTNRTWLSGPSQTALSLAIRAALFGVALTLALPLPISAAEAPINSEIKNYAIPAGPLADTLALFAASSGVQLSFDPTPLAGLRSPGLQGSFSVREGFTRLLAGSGFTLESKGERAFTLRRVETKENEVTLKPVKVRDKPEVATGPVIGYAAKRTMTGTRTDTELRDIPQTVNIVTRDELRDRGVTRMTDVFSTVPGAQVATGYGGLANGRGIYLRGFGTDTDYRDGFRDFSFVSPRDVALFERIEVLKGPSAVIYGTNDPGGSVNYVTKRPQFDTTEQEVVLTVGSYDTYRATVDVGGTLIESGNLAYRMVAVYDDRDSHRDYVNSRTRVLAPSLALRLGENTQLTALTEFIRYDYIFERGFPTEEAFLNLPRERFLEEPGINDAETTSDRYTLELTHAFNTAWNLRAAFSYLKPTIEKTNLYPLGMADERTLDRSLDYSEEYQKDRAGQVEMTGNLETGTWSHTVLFGLEHYRNNFHYTFAPFDVSSAIDIYDPVYGQVVIPPDFFDTVAFGNDYGSHTSAIYLQDQVTFSPHWKMTVGARYDRARLFNDDLVNPSESMDKQTQSKTSPRVGVVYQPSSATALFAGYSTSFKPQIFNLKIDGSLPKAEEGRQYELGWRQDVFDRLHSTLSVFEIYKENVSTSDVENPGFMIQVGEQRSRGIEWELRGQATDAVELIAASAYIDAEVTEDNDIPEGDQLDSSPRFSASLWAKYQPQSLGWFAGGGIFYTGQREGSLPNNGVQLPSETRLDALLGYEMRHWRAQLNFHNLTDEDIYIPYSSGLFVPGAGRSAELSLRYGW